MRHLRVGSNLGRKSGHRKAMLQNLSASIIDKGRVETTLPRAKIVRGVVERAITYAKKGDLHGIRLAARVIKDKTILKKLTSEVAPGFKDRQGGYTRIIKTEERDGDNAMMCYIELVGGGDTDVKRKMKSATKKSSKKKVVKTSEVAKVLARNKGGKKAVAAEVAPEVTAVGTTQSEEKN